VLIVAPIPNCLLVLLF